MGDYIGSYLGKKKQDTFDHVLASTRGRIMVRLREAQEQVDNLSISFFCLCKDILAYCDYRQRV